MRTKQNGKQQIIAKQIGIATGIVGTAGALALGVYNVTHHDYALYALLVLAFLMAIGIVALIRTYLRRGDNNA